MSRRPCRCAGSRPLQTQRRTVSGVRETNAAAAVTSSITTSSVLRMVEGYYTRPRRCASVRGIRKPAGMGAALSIRTVYTKPGATPPYADAEGPDGLIRYKYRGGDPLHPENRALRRAYLDGLPVIWFVGVAPASYKPVYPVWIVGDEPKQLQFAIALDQGQRLVEPGADVGADTKRYMEQLNKVRLHQPLFRARVLTAYESRCALCRLGHVDPPHTSFRTADRTATRSSPTAWRCARSTTRRMTETSSACVPTLWWRSARTSSGKLTVRCSATACRR